MIRSFRPLLLTAALGCAAAPSRSPDSTRVAEHDPALHAAHTAAPGTSAASADTGFAALQARGAIGMGVDQYTSSHTFEPLDDGGRITLRRDVDDSAGVEQIRAHLRTIAAAFAAGDFTTPAFVHADTVPGTDVMRARHGSIRYRVAPLARGGELVITTSDPAALDAIHRFLAYQRREHRTANGAANASPPLH